LSQRVEPKGAFTAQETPLPEYRGLPEPEWLKEERYALSKKMMGQLKAAVRDPAPTPRPKSDGKISSGITNTGMEFQMWRDSEGRDYAYFPDHPINEQIKQRGSGFEKSPDEGRKFGRAFRDG